MSLRIGSETEAPTFLEKHFHRRPMTGESTRSGTEKATEQNVAGNAEITETILHHSRRHIQIIATASPALEHGRGSQETEDDRDMKSHLVLPYLTAHARARPALGRSPMRLTDTQEEASTASRRESRTGMRTVVGRQDQDCRHHVATVSSFDILMLTCVNVCCSGQRPRLSSCELL